jgi:hypothetical protein
MLVNLYESKEGSEPGTPAEALEKPAPPDSQAFSLKRDLVLYDLVN